MSVCLFVGRSAGLSICHNVEVCIQKQLNLSRCRLVCGLGLAQGTTYWDGGPDSPCERTVLSGKRHQYRKWLNERAAERARTTIILLQRNTSFGETPDQVHFSCRKLCRKVTKYDAYILCLTASVSYELFERPSYTVFECSESNSITLAAVHIMSQISTLYAFTAEPRLPKWT